MICGIYCFTNKINGKRYVGQSGDVERRIRDHWRALKRGKDNCVYLQNAYDKYGESAFDVSVLVECFPEHLDYFEKEYISLYCSADPKYGYNISTGGSRGLLGHKKSKETRKRMSLANTKERHPMWGKKHTPETIQKYKEERAGTNAYQFGTKKKDAHSSYYGVYRVPRKGHIYWCSYIKVNGERLYIGSSKDELLVAKMYDQFIVENNLPNPLNFPEEWR